VSINHLPQKVVLVLICLFRTGANRVFIFDHTIRRAPADRRDGTTQIRGPGKRVHIDQSYRASEGRVKHHLPDEAEELLKKRFQIINVRSPHLDLAIYKTDYSPHHYRSGDPSRLSSETRSPSRTPIPCPTAT
jgi:hypothetical protein